MKLPLQEMYDALGTDTLNSVSMSFTKYKNVSDNSEENPYKMGTPKNLLLIRKNEVKDFFEKQNPAALQEVTAVMMETARK